MSTDTNLLGKGLIRLGILVFLFIASPILLTMGFKAFDIDHYIGSSEADIFFGSNGNDITLQGDEQPFCNRYPLRFSWIHLWTVAGIVCIWIS